METSHVVIVGLLMLVSVITWVQYQLTELKDKITLLEGDTESLNIRQSSTSNALYRLELSIVKRLRKLEKHAKKRSK